MNILEKIFGELSIHIGKGKIFLMFFSVSFISIILSMEPLFFGKVISELEKFYITQSFSYHNLFVLTLFWLAFTFVFQGLKYLIWQYIITHHLIIDYTLSVKKYANIVFHMTFPAYLGKQIGSVYKIIDRGTDNKLFFFFSFFENFLFNIVSILFIIVVLFFLHVQMAFITIALIPFVGFLGYYFMTKTSIKQNQLTDRWDEIFAIIGNAMSNFGLFKILSLDTIFSRNIDTILKGCFDDQMKLNKQWNFSDVYVVLAVMLTRVFVLVSGVYFILRGSLTLSELFVIFSYVGWIYFPLGGIFRELRNTVKQLTEVNKLYTDLGNLPIESTQDNEKNLEKVTGNIEFKEVSFGYSPERNILKNLNIEIQPGQKIAFVGNTGAGKSTIISLLLRFWDVSKGEICIDGKNIQNFSKTSLRQHFGVVSQDNSLFNLSIEENLRFAKPKATKKEIIQALTNAEAHFVFDLPHGIKTVIGERGLKLSGGEKQRISLARLFLKNPEILILDEATSALDTKTEKLVTKALHTLMKDKTSIIIAHRISTIMSADKIFVLENGKIVESGSYHELIEKKGKFFTLANPESLVIG